MSLFSCTEKKAVAKAAAADSFRIELPQNGSIEAAEKKHIEKASAHFFDTLLNKKAFNGGLLVAKNGNIIFEKYSSTATDPVSAETPLHIASVTKTFTAMMILKLQEEGKLNVHDLYKKYFPRFDFPGVTIQTLLNHRSGIPNYLYFMEDGGWNKDSLVSNNDVLNWLIEKKGQVKNIGTADKGFSYSNTNYVLLALLIEKLSGKSYPEYMRERIFAPLGMKNSFVHYQTDTTPRTKSFDWKGREIADDFLDATYGDKNIYSTPRDLLLWSRALKPGIFLKAASLDSAFKGYSTERAGIRNYGLGFRMNDYPNGKKMVYHNGWWHGNNATFILLRDEDGVIIALNNHFTRNTYKAKAIVNAFGFYFHKDADDGDAPEQKTDTLAKKK